MLKLSVIGTGYLGATHAAAMSSLGFEVVGTDGGHGNPAFNRVVDRAI